MQTWLSFVVFDTFNVLNILSYPVSSMGPTMVGPREKISKQRFPDGWKTLDSVDDIMRLIFAHIISHKRVVLSGTP